MDKLIFDQSKISERFQLTLLLILEGSVCVRESECVYVFAYNLYTIYKRAFSSIFAVRLCGWIIIF